MAKQRIENAGLPGTTPAARRTGDNKKNAGAHTAIAPALHAGGITIPAARRR